MTDDFSRSVVDIIFRRAGGMCSNPDCLALTSGPATDVSKAVSVGEAAHIFGARLGSARFDPSMSSSERSDSTNAIWLCRNCHKIVDADEKRYSTDLLFRWRHEHEMAVLKRLGKAGDILQAEMLEKRLAGFESASLLARQIASDKPKHWEYKLLAELLRSGLNPIRSKWLALKNGLYALPNERIPKVDVLNWFSTKMDDLSNQVTAVDRIVNVGLQTAMGPPGVPGDELAILDTCKLLTQACMRILEWEEGVRFSSPPHGLEKTKALLVGLGGRNIERVFEIPSWLAQIFSTEEPTGEHSLSIVFDMPENWETSMADAFRQIRASYES
jgi:DNA-binding HxlR family transcriptional regulator